MQISILLLFRSFLYIFYLAIQYYAKKIIIVISRKLTFQFLRLGIFNALNVNSAVSSV